MVKCILYKLLTLPVLLFIGHDYALATGGTEVLKSSQKDKVTIQYDISERDGMVSVLFTKVNKELGIENSGKYRDYEKIQVVFFEWAGVYQQAEFSAKEGINIRPFRIKRDELLYQNTNEGFFRLEDNPEIRFKMVTDHDATLTIPIYLTYYKKKRQYETFAYCGDLSIRISPKQQRENTSGKQTQRRTKTITTTEEVEVEQDLSPIEVANNVLNNANEYINNPDVTADDLKHYIQQLDDSRSHIKDDATIKKITEVILICKQRLNDLTQKETADREHSVEQAMLLQQKEKAQQDMNYVNERTSNIDDLSDSELGDLRAASNELRRQSYALKDKDPELSNQMIKTADGCDQKLKEIEDGKKRRNIWLIIGGILLMVLMFVGNQTFSHFRNLKNQKGIEKMQNSIAKRAQDEARRRAQSMARSKINKVQSQVRQKSRDAVRKGVNSAVSSTVKGAKGGKSKSISI